MSAVVSFEQLSFFLTFAELRNRDENREAILQSNFTVVK